MPEFDHNIQAFRQKNDLNDRHAHANRLACVEPLTRQANSSTVEAKLKKQRGHERFHMRFRSNSA